ncbi:hypothetical protein [Nostoc sp.]|uniref:hypothetical protein n=1 Tax=Nostoc sp. TaxID=1180 RepID=UPI002FF47CCE
MHIEAAGEQGAGSKGEELQVLPNHACDAICRRNSLPRRFSHWSLVVGTNEREFDWLYYVHLKDL